MINRHRVTLISIGNGTASRETEKLAAELTRNAARTKYLIVNEAGASVYSASALARQEFPELDVTIRGAISIARRAQDPLAELVKIDPKSIGVGLYQHDVDQTSLAHALDGVVESVVNRVGVDVNTASPALLTHVAGVGPKLAVNIVAHRDENGPFKSRAALRKVSGLGPEALAAELDCGMPTLKDILEQMIRPGRDPRVDAPLPILRSDVLKAEDLVTGMQLKGTVRNVVDFGAFIDIGIKQDGLLHRTQIPTGTVLKVGDIIEVEILKIESERGRIGLGWIN